MTNDGTTFDSPAFETAVKARKLFGGGPAPPTISASQRAQLVAFARCMRTHGVMHFPDPVFPAGGGIEHNIPSTLGSSAPAAARTPKACTKP